MAQTNGIRKIRYQPYKFDPDDAFRFAREIGERASRRGDELEFYRCPYCHGHMKDKKTFSINLKTGQFQCFRASCGRRGNMISLSQDFGFSLGTEVDEYYRPQPKKYRSLKQSETPIVPKAPAIAYLESRGIGEEVAKKYEITTQTGRDNILVFPFYDENNILQFVKYRKTDFNKEKDNAKEWCEKDCKPILFGIKQCDVSTKTLIITEGQIDSLSCAEAGYKNAVSVPTGAKGFTWVSHCWEWILNNFETIIVFGDHEHGHITLLDELRKKFYMLNVKNVRTEDYKDCKDANDILRKYGKEQIKTCIENAVEAPINHVVSLADIPDIDIYSIKKLKTGIRALDSLLYGGLPFGGVTLISGKPGEGKSTLASEILVRAAEQGYRCFAYSGELNASLFKTWMNFQVAGKKHIYTNENDFGNKIYGISEVNRKAIAEWYRDKIDFYDYNSLAEEDTESDGVIETCQKEISRNGASVILIDNLMTALDLEASGESDKYERQSKFVKKLTRMCLTFNCLVLLVAHKRKNNFSTNSNDEIAGSSDIANLGMVVLSYEKTEDRDSPDRILKVSKNRLFGKTNTEGWVMHYDEPSKRIYGDGDDPDYEIGWNKSSIAYKMDHPEEYEFT